MSNTIKNTINIINSRDLKVLKEKLQVNNRSFVVELDGIKIQSWVDYISEIQSKFRFPSSCIDSVDRYLDWIRDLEWLEQEEFAIIINKFKDFCKDNPKTRNEIIQEFEETILPFWQEDVKNVVVGGSPKSFMVYLVE
jgi:hypothetical protein